MPGTVTSFSDHFDDVAFVGCVPLALSLLAEPDATAKGSWNRACNLGLDKSTRALITRRSRPAPRTMVIGGLSSSSPSSKALLPYNSWVAAEAAGNSKRLLLSALSVGAGLSRSCRAGGGEHNSGWLGLRFWNGESHFVSVVGIAVAVPFE